MEKFTCSSLSTNNSFFFSLFLQTNYCTLSLSLSFFFHQILMNTTCCHIPTVLVYLLKLLDSNCSSVKLQDILLQTVLCLQQISFNMMMKSIIQIVQLAQFFRMNVSSYSHMIGSFMSKIEDIKRRKKISWSWLRCVNILCHYQMFKSLFIRKAFCDIWNWLGGRWRGIDPARLYSWTGVSTKGAGWYRWTRINNPWQKSVNQNQSSKLL